MLDQIISGTNLPNLHPAVLHFPIVLLSLAVPLEIIALLRHRQRSLQVASVLVYLLGSVAALATWWTGRQAADAVGLVDAQTQTMIAAHSDLALKVVWFFGIVALGRLSLDVLRQRMDPTVSLVFRIVLLLPALVGIWMLGETADRGGGLVYVRGVAVQGIQTPGPDKASSATGVPVATLGDENETPGRGFTPLIIGDNGSLTWRPGPGEKDALGRTIEVVTASPGAEVRVIDDETSAEGLSLESSGMVFLLLPSRQENVLAIADIDFTSFNGRIGLVHHFQDKNTYECMVIGSAGSASLLDCSAGKTDKLDDAEIDLPSGSNRIGVSAAGSHLKGYLDGQTIVHGHRTDRGVVGKVGLMLDGNGKVRILELKLDPAESSH